LEEQMGQWAKTVNEILHKSANGRMVSEWAKKPECWTAVRKGTYSPLIEGIPELKPAGSGASPLPANVISASG
jgi:hypothetical protein